NSSHRRNSPRGRKTTRAPSAIAKKSAARIGSTAPKRATAARTSSRSRSTTRGARSTSVTTWWMCDENLRQPHPDGDDLRRHLLGLQGAAAGAGELAANTRKDLRRRYRPQRLQRTVLVGRNIQMRAGAKRRQMASSWLSTRTAGASMKRSAQTLITVALMI